MNTPVTPDQLCQHLSQHGIAYHRTDHPAVFTVAETAPHRDEMIGHHTKNLFLKDKKGRLWLISARQDTVIDLKRAPKTIGSDRLSFGNEALLYETLGVRGGSVTALGLINDPDQRVTFVLDKALWDADIVNFHPLTNTATTALGQADFRRFMSLIGREPMVVDFGKLSA